MSLFNDDQYTDEPDPRLIEELERQAWSLGFGQDRVAESAASGICSLCGRVPCLCGTFPEAPEVPSK